MTHRALPLESPYLLGFILRHWPDFDNFTVLRQHVAGTRKSADDVMS
jgi:hypothetical protein